MRRPLAAAVLGGLLALPAPAFACTLPHPAIEVSRVRVAPGATVRVTGEQVADAKGNRQACHPVYPPSPSESATPEPVGVEPSEDPEPTPLVTLPPLRRVAATAAADPRTLVRVTIAPWYDTFAVEQPPDRVLDRVTHERTAVDDRYYRYSFAADVTIPRDVKPGRYVLRAYQQVGIYFGRVDVEVGDLATTGADLSGLAVLALVAAGGALYLSRRAGGSSPRHA